MKRMSNHIFCNFQFNIFNFPWVYIKYVFFVWMQFSRNIEMLSFNQIKISSTQLTYS